MRKSEREEREKGRRIKPIKRAETRERTETELALIKRKQNREMIFIVYLFALLFFGMIVYFSYFILFQAKDKMGSP